MNKLFKVSENCSFAFIMSILSGTPSNAKYLKDLYDNSFYKKERTEKFLSFQCRKMWHYLIFTDLTLLHLP